jgi:hypothetical protein
MIVNYLVTSFGISRNYGRMRSIMTFPTTTMMRKVLISPFRNYATRNSDDYNDCNIPNELAKLNAERHDGFCAWTKAIKNAKIIQLDPSDEWKEDENLIQVKTMGFDEHESDAHVPCPETEHEYDDCLYVIKIPLAIPLEQGDPASNFVFIRPDDVSLFDCFRRTYWCILVGNRGIAKSWFQWKYILLCYRRDLFRLLKSQLPEVEDEDPPIFPKKYGILEASLDQSSLVPKLIVRTVAGKKSLFFYTDQTNNVFYAEHSPGALESCTDDNSMILWEPDKENTPLEYHWCKSRIIATVSPQQKQYPEFQQKAMTFYMPCPSELQLRLMGQIFRSIAEEFGDCPNDKELHERIRKYGPYIRSSFFWSEIQRKEFQNERDMEIGRIYASGKSLLSALDSPSYSDSPKAFSHMIRYKVNRNSADMYGGYVVPKYAYASGKVLDAINDEISKLDIESVMKALRP